MACTRMKRANTDKKLVSIVLWRIEKLSNFVPELHGRSIESPSFLSSNRSFTMELLPMGENEADSNLVLRFHSTSDHDSLLDCEWSVLDADGSPLITSFLQNKVIEKYDSLDLPNCPTQEEVFLTRKSSFLPNDTFTMRFRILHPNRDFSQAEHISIVTRINVLEESFIWRIQKFETFDLGDEVTADVHLKDEYTSTDLLFKFSLTGESLNEASVKVEIVSEVLFNLYGIKLVISDKKQNSIKCVEASYGALLDIRDRIWVLPEFLSRQEILEDSSMWLCGDDLILLCKIDIIPNTIYNKIEKCYHGPEHPKIGFPKNTQSVEESESKEIIGTKPKKMKKSSTFTESNSATSPQSSNHPDNHPQRTLAILVKDLMSMYQERNFSDFELRSGDVSFPVHKVVLSARSPVFKAMFSGNMQEANSDFLVVPDVNPHTLGRMLTFLYAGTVDTLQFEDAAKLYYAADKYQVQSLKQECSSILKSNISVSNVSDVLEFADRHQDQDLTSFVHDFILDHFDEVMFSDEWNKFMDRNLLAGKTSMKIYKIKHEMKHQCDPLESNVIHLD